MDDGRKRSCPFRNVSPSRHGKTQSYPFLPNLVESARTQQNVRAVRANLIRDVVFFITLSAVCSYSEHSRQQLASFIVICNSGFAMFWAPEVPKWSDESKLCSVTVWAGENYFGVLKNNAPPPDSWASDPANDVAVMHITVQPGGKMTLPKAHSGKSVTRTLFYIEGAADAMKVGGQAIPEKVLIKVEPDSDIELEMSASASQAGEFLLLQGKPIAEPVAQHGPFVMNTREEIQQAFMDYQRTQFGGWPWDRDDMIFDRTKGRFALLNKKETEPPKDQCTS